MNAARKESVHLDCWGCNRGFRHNQGGRRAEKAKFVEEFALPVIPWYTDQAFGESREFAGLTCVDFSSVVSFHSKTAAS